MLPSVGVNVLKFQVEGTYSTVKKQTEGTFFSEEQLFINFYCAETKSEHLINLHILTSSNVNDGNKV